MLRPQMRDEIRAHAEIPGSTSMTGLINSAISQTLDRLTALAKYDECFTPDFSIPIIANGVVSLPTNLQHLDENMIYFLIDGLVDDRNRYRLHPFTRTRNRNIGRASQFRLYGVSTGGIQLRKLQVSPFVNINIATDRVAIDYWAKLNWDNDNFNCPIQKLEETIILQAAARIAKGTNSRLATKLKNLGQEAYIAARASSLKY